MGWNNGDFLQNVQNTGKDKEEFPKLFENWLLYKYMYFKQLFFLIISKIYLALLSVILL